MSPHTESTTSTTHFLGKTRTNVRVFAHIELTRTDKEVHFTDHTHGPLGARLAVSASTVTPASARRRDIDTGGQCAYVLDEIVITATGWTFPDINSLKYIWADHHLNDLIAHSDELANHPAVINATQDNIRERLVLVDSTGYRYGTEWLARRIPDHVIAEITRLQNMPSGDVPDWLN